MNFSFINLIYLVFLNILIDELNGEETEKDFEDLSSYPPYLAVEEVQVYKIIKSFSLENTQNEAIPKYLLDFEETGLKSNSDWDEAVEFTKNPLAMYRLTRRFVKEYKAVERILKIFNETERLKELQKINKRVQGFPNSKDLSDYLHAMLNFQDIYDLKALNIAQGKLLEAETGINLHGRHCFEIAEFALKIKQFTMAFEWLDAAEEAKDLKQEYLSSDEIKKLRELIITNHDKDWERNFKTNSKYIFQTKLKSLESTKLDKSLLRRNKDLLRNKYFGNFTTEVSQQMEFNFMALCKGTKLRTPKYEQSLNCWLDTKRGPYWRINPLRIEMVNKDPYIFLIHNPFPDSWIKKCMQMAWEMKTNTYEAFDKESLSNIPIFKRYELLSNLKPQNYFKINIYAAGALLYPHIDTARNKYNLDIINGEIMVSSVFYINPAEIGGATVFPYLGLSVKAPAGSILIWNNTLRNGEFDKKMIHGGCPVVYGHKWVATTWILNNINFLKRPCELDKTK